MKTASRLLALVVVLGFCREVGAYSRTTTIHNYTVSIAGNRFGFEDGTTYWSGDGVTNIYSYIHIGPLGFRNSSFTANQGLIGFCCILAVLIALPIVVLVTWRKKRVAP